MKKQYLIYYITTLLLIGIFCQGCGDPVVTPEKVKNEKNTFRLSYWYGKITSVKVHEYSSNKVWVIEPQKKVSLHGFKVTVGQVPEDFTQTTPKPPEKFSLKVGNKYSIVINVDSLRYINLRPLSFIAE